MWSVCILLIGIGQFSELLAAPADSSSNTVRCYDCHYDPGALQQSSDGTWVTTGSGGFARCALKNADDHDFLNKYGCTKGKCFIRRDPNGQVFRGCADPWNLPWGVDINNNCKQQYDKSVWWFCDGEVCNHGQIDDKDRCENLPKLKKRKVDETDEDTESKGYEQPQQDSPEEHLYTESKEPPIPISATVESKDDSLTAPVYTKERDTSLPSETVYGNEYSDPKAWYDLYLSKFSNDPNTKPHYHKDDADFTDDGGNSNNVFYSRLQEKYIVMEPDEPVHHYTDSELSYNTDLNQNTYDYVLPDDYGRTPQFNSVEELPPPTYVDLDPYEPEEEAAADPAVYDDYYAEGDETAYGYPDPDEAENEVENAIDGAGYYGEEGAYFSYDSPEPPQVQEAYTTDSSSHFPQDWFYREVDHLARQNFPFGWYPYFFPWFYGHHSAAADASVSSAQGYEQEEPKKSHEPSPQKTHYEPPKKSHPPPKSYEPPKKSHSPPPKKYTPPQKSHPPPKKTYQPPPKSHPPQKKNYGSSAQISTYLSPTKKSPEPQPKKSHPPPPAPAKKSYEPPKKSHEPQPKKSYQPPPKKSYEPPPKKSYQPPPKKSYEPPPKKSYQPPPKKSYEPPPKKSYEPPPKKSYQPPPKKSQPAKPSSPGKVFEPEGGADRDENTAYSLGGNLQVLGNTLIPVDAHQDGINAYVPDDGYEDSNADVYEYVYVYDDDDGNTVTRDVSQNYVYVPNSAGTDNLYDPNAVTDDTEYYYEYSHRLPTPSQAVQNLCTGTCGLFPHPDAGRNQQFVQCGPGVHYGKTCDCCQAYEHTCSDGTSFDARIGVCSQGTDSSYDSASYKPIY